MWLEAELSTYGGALLENATTREPHRPNKCLLRRENRHSKLLFESDIHDSTERTAAARRENIRTASTLQLSIVLPRHHSLCTYSDTAQRLRFRKCQQGELGGCGNRRALFSKPQAVLLCPVPLEMDGSLPNVSAPSAVRFLAAFVC